MEGVAGTFREHPVEVAGTILESILGLGAIYKQHGFEELTELPEMLTMLESDLMSQNTNFRSRRLRRKEWQWDEFDEIWGFDQIPESYPDYQIRAEALRDRHERGVPTMIDERDLPDFYARMERRRESRMRRG
eukprot:2486287-Heterocapsa_arctica.AAC.1